MSYILKTMILAITMVIASLQATSADDKSVLASIDKNFQQQINFLEEIVNQNSGTLNIPGVRDVGRSFEREFTALGFETRWIEMPENMNRAGHFIATKAFGEGPHILLIGHLDTVFEQNSPFQKFERDGEEASGPGISDMKGGNTVILYALKAIMETNAANAGTVTVFFTGDEESVGSPIDHARRDLISAGKAADIALNFEGGSAEWGVIGRRGSSNWSLEVTGKQSHSSGIFRDGVGAGAVFEMSRILNRFYGEVRGPFGLTFNPGVLAGGTLVNQGETPNDFNTYGKGNVVAQKAVVQGGLRFMNQAQLDAARAAMRGIVEDSLPETSAKITFEDRYPAMEETEANKNLLAKLNTVHTRLGLEPAKSFPPERRGAADISFIAPFVTSMDGLGVSGRGAHSPRERMNIESMRMATKRSALLITDLLSGK
ncbi:M20/M25/M40 family metallo-hydrolase [Kordiimonas aquimaris]|uniref:M20/M25/M40 family metallo-hydrolase n=1 Tax=Kordiimonas aquimaris TaxID=707591 RepID=UPI0021CFE14E|nr:M20/M25/M40 family metallo-hydrolase [Kordiimonas aquimaris]